MLALIFNNKTTIKAQLVLCFSSIVLFTFGISIAICFGLLFKMGDEAYLSSKSTIRSATIDSLSDQANEIAGTLSQQLTIISNLVCSMGALYSKNLHEYIKLSESYLAPQVSFREYNFGTSTCSFPKCPTDYGSLQGKTRIPWIEDFQYGSFEHSSVYLYEKDSNQSARNDHDWINITTHDPQINRTIDAISYQDQDMNIMYNQGPNNTVFFYSSSKVENLSNNNYFSIHRTFPGVVKNMTYYDASSRSWFTKAPTESSYFSAYKETFTNQLVINLSSKREFLEQSTNYRFTLVAAALVLLSDLQSIVYDIQYSNGGFGALVKYDTQEVLCWKKGYQITYDDNLARFPYLDEIEPNLNQIDIKSSNYFEYSDTSGVRWMVSSVPFFNSNTYNNPKSKYSLMVLVFARKDLAETTLPDLHDRITNSENKVTTTTGIIVACLFFVVISFVSIIIVNITSPIENIRKISELIIKISCEDEITRDYSSVLNEKMFTTLGSGRSDEVAVLTNDFYKIVCKLNNRVEAKKATPKYFDNPFHISDQTINVKHLNWGIFFEHLFPMSIIPDTNLSTVKPQAMDSAADGDTGNELDILGSLTREKKKGGYISLGIPNKGDIEMGDVQIDVPTASAPTAPTVEGVEIDTQVASMKQFPSLDLKVSQYKSNMNHNQSKIIDLPAPKETNSLSSIRFKFYLSSFLIVVASLVIMIYTVVTLQNDGATWMENTGNDLKAKQIENLIAIAQIKGKLVESYFQQVILDLKITSNYMQNILDGSWRLYNPPKYLSSFSMDPNNPFTYPYSIQSSDQFSGYFIKNDINGYIHGYNITNDTSLFDIKYRSLVYGGSLMIISQYGNEADGFFRSYPYLPKPKYVNGDCFIEDTTDPQCLSSYQTSRCSDQTNNILKYPDYDPRCRLWYQMSKKQSDQSVYFLYPRVDSTNNYVLTSVTKVIVNGVFKGVINSNTLVDVLSLSVNNLKILDNGYTYIIDAYNVSNIVIHPYSNCGFVKCSESFSDSEYANFYDTILMPIQNLAVNGNSNPLPSLYYTKGGNLWMLSYSTVEIESIHYSVIATVPYNDVIKSSKEVEASINTTVVSMIVAFTLIMFFFVVLHFFFSRFLVRSIIDPIDQLRNLVHLISEDNYSGSIPENPSSLDVKVLLDAFSNLVVALKFANENLSRGNRSLAEQIYTDALNLFTATGNIKGLGASHNNLAAIDMSKGLFVSAETHYYHSIKFCETAIVKAESSDESLRLKKTLSDRKGNLALLYLERNDMTEKYPVAFEMLEKLLLEDKKIGYIKGCVVKQGTLGQFYLRQGEMASAQKILESALTFVRLKDASIFEEGWNEMEASASEQIALLNLAYIYLEAPKHSIDLSLCETKLLEALVVPTKMHTASTEKIFSSLRKIYQDSRQSDSLKQLNAIADAFGFLKFNQTNSVVQKRVAFAIDYSGSMSGEKIRSAVENLQMLFDNNISVGDSIMLLHFTEKISIDFDLTVKSASNADFFRSKIQALVYPSGSTAFYDAVNTALSKFKTRPSDMDWIVALTDGDDNSSKITQKNLINYLSSAHSGLGIIIIGVGNDVNTEILTSIVKSRSQKGIYVSANGDKKSINEAFLKVSEIIIQGNVLLEESF